MIMINDDSGLIFTSFMARSKLFPKAYKQEKLKKCTVIMLCDMRTQLTLIPLNYKGRSHSVTLSEGHFMGIF